LTQIKPGEVLVAGSLSTRRRTVAGLIGQSQLMGLDEQAVADVLRAAGLPARALEDPDFPIGVDQELRALARALEPLLLRQRSIALFSLATFNAVGINFYGVLGLAMQHAPTILEALRAMLAFPELAWGHSRIAGRVENGSFVLGFELGVDVPADLDPDRDGGLLREYCVTTDLASVQRMVADLTGPDHGPRLIELPFAEPPNAAPVLAGLPCPVIFDAVRAAVHYPAAVVDVVPVLSAALPWRRYMKLAESFSRVLAEEVEVPEQVTRLLWAYTPAPSREQIADMLGTSPRTLARRLKNAGTSFAALHRSVQQERATNFLRHTSMPMAEVAERLGYSDAAAFTRAFQAWTGQAPSHWRRQEKARA
jgi:AraC-like DNA-binding protein